MRTAVTEGAPAAAHDTPNSEFLPTDKNYRLTGEMPAETETASAAATEEEIETEQEELETTTAATEDESATSKSDTAAASEAATTQKKTKTAATSENRYQKLSRENRELREKIARAEGRAEGASSAQKPREGEQVARPATETATKDRPEPKIDDIDPKTNKPKYATLGEYLADQRKWDRDQLLAEIDQRSAKTQQETLQAQTEQVIAKTVKERADAARKTYSDYDDVMTGVLEIKDEHGQEAFFLGKGTAVEAFLLDSERGHEVMYAMAKNPDAYKHIFARDATGKQYLMNAVRQLRELAKVEHSLPAKDKSSSTSSSARQVTQAPRPPHQVSGKGTVTKDAIERAVEEGDSETYIREQNARDLARRKKG